VTDSPDPPRSPLTATVSTVQGWPEMAEAVMTVISSARAAGGDVIVTDGSGRPPPPADVIGPGVAWLSHPGESVFQLRERAYGLAAGALVAITEDHVEVPEGWARQLIEAHERHPEASAIGGSVVNGATGSLIDWASFLVVQAPVAAPIRSGRAGRMAGAVNVAYKRSALAHRPSFGDMGAMDGLHQKALATAGAILLNDDSIRVSHDQALGVRGFTAIHYNAGRTISGFKRRHLGPIDLLRIVGSPFVPLARYLRTVILLAPRGYGSILLRATPWILWLLYAQGVGQLVGYLAGPGDSPNRVQ
jgi:hypothetical protein